MSVEAQYELAIQIKKDGGGFLPRVIMSLMQTPTATLRVVHDENDKEFPIFCKGLTLAQAAGFHDIVSGLASGITENRDALLTVLKERLPKEIDRLVQSKE